MARKVYYTKLDTNFVNPYLEGTREEFLQNNMKLVYKVANKFRTLAQKNGLEMEEIINIGSMGLIKVYHKYDPTKFEGVHSFSTYAVPMIEGEIRRELRDNYYFEAKVSRIPKKIGLKLQIEGKENLSIEKIMEEFSCSRQIAELAKEYANGMTKANSLNDVIFAGKDDVIELHEQLGSEDDFSSVFMEDFMKFLTEKERIIIKLLLEDKTQREIGAVIGISQSQVSRMIKKIGVKLKRYMNGEPIETTEEIEKRKKVEQRKQRDSR